MKSVATPFRTFQTPVNTNVNRMITRSMAQTMPQTAPTRNFLAGQFTADSGQTPLQLHERRQAFLFRNISPMHTSTSSSINTLPATSSSSDSLLGGLGNVRAPSNKFMRFVHERITPRWQQFQPRAVQFVKRHKRKIGTGLGILGGTAIVGGTLGAILGKDNTQEYSEPLFNQMPAGNTIYSGGGGGGGGGGSLSPYSGIMGPQYVRRVHKQKRKSRKSINKRKISKNYLKLKSAKRFKRKPKRRVKKRKTSRKKSKSRKFPAF